MIPVPSFGDDVTIVPVHVPIGTQMQVCNGAVYVGKVGIVGSGGYGTGIEPGTTPAK